MDPRLLKYYNRELQFMREMGAEFAKSYPKIASRLSLDEFECADPYVERLLEGFSFPRCQNPTQDRRGVSALYPTSDGAGLSSLSLPYSFDDGGTVPGRHA